MLDGKLEQPVAAVQVQLGADVVPVCLDRAVADAQFFGDFFAGAIVSDSL